MNRKLLFFDIDGTLLSEKTHTVPQSTIKALKQAKDNGHLLFINTGRTRCTIDKCIEDLKPNGYICGCGTYISYLENVLYHFQVRPKRCQEIIALLEKYHIYGIFEASDKVYFPRDLSDQTIAFLYQLYHDAGFDIDFFDSKDVHLDKFCIQFYHDVSNFYQSIENDFEIIKRKPYFSEIVPQGHSKATGIQYIVDYFQLSLDDCYVFGDSFNDASMLNYVKHSIVMKNGEPELYKIAEYMTDDIENDGIEKALKHYQLI